MTQGFLLNKQSLDFETFCEKNNFFKKGFGKGWLKGKWFP